MAPPMDVMRRLSAATADLLLSRAEFASLELAQARARFIRWIVLALFAMLLLLLALIAGSTLLAVTLWPRFGWITLAVLFAVYALAAWWVFRMLASEVSAEPPVLSETLRALSDDRAALFAGRRREDEGGAS